MNKNEKNYLNNIIKERNELERLYDKKANQNRALSHEADINPLLGRYSSIIIKSNEKAMKFLEENIINYNEEIDFLQLTHSDFI